MGLHEAHPLGALRRRGDWAKAGEVRNTARRDYALGASRRREPGLTRPPVAIVAGPT